MLFNAVELVYIVRRRVTRRDRKRATLFVISLCVSDLLLGINMIVLKVMHRFMNTDLMGNRTAHIFYDLIRFGCIRLSFVLSVLSMAAITYDRYLAITNPFVHRSKGRGFFKRTICGLWGVAIVVTVVLYTLFTFPLEDQGVVYMDLLFPLSTFTVLPVFLYCYYNIYVFVKNLRKEISRKGSNLSPPDHQLSVGRPICRTLSALSSASCEDVIPEGKRSSGGISLTSVTTVRTTNPEAPHLAPPPRDPSHIYVISREETVKTKNEVCRHKEVEQRLLVLAVWNVSLFLLCWCPIAVCCVIALADDRFPRDVYATFFVLANMNALLNPILYFVNLHT